MFGENRLLWGAAVATAFLAFGCPSGGGTPADNSCTSDSDCTGTNEICHPGAKVCVQTCEASADCPSSAKTCEALSDTDTRQICKCTTDALCNDGNDEGTLVCSTTYSVCVSEDTTPTDGGTLPGTCSWSTCSTSGFSAAGQTCTASGCAAGAACSGAGQTTCAQNEYCASGACGLPPYPTQASCQNFHAGDHASGPIWNPATATGPVIFSVTEVSHGDGQFGTGACSSGTDTSANCQCNPGDTQWNVRVLAYRTDTAWPATRAGLSGFFYVPVDGDDRDILASPTLLRPNIGYNNNQGNDAIREFNLYFCSSAQNAFQPGFYFTGGNEACRQL